ncbi:MAG TPA: FtsX-like permease family protein [Planctomycetota bacterium]|nr:FtsX-like permease family protein [Planctomycetota bacterium]
MSQQVAIARRTLQYHRKRLVAALAGVVFAVILVNMEVGILLGFMANATGFIDRLPGDVWIMSRGTPNFDMCHEIAEPNLQRVRAIEGVDWADKMIVAWSVWKTAEGREENLEVVGIETGSRLEVPWPVEPPEAARLGDPHGVIIDRAEQQRLQVASAGDAAEIMDNRVKVAGFTTGMRSFTTTPYVIMRFEHAEKSSLLPPNTTSYIVAKARPDWTPERLREHMTRELPMVDVLTTEEFHARTRDYWLFTTGVGTAFFMAALLGFLVGGAVVGQVLYALVVEQRGEFGVLKAMGASRGFLCRVVLGQALIIALSGYAAGLALTLPLISLMRSMGTPMTLTWPLAAGGFAAVVAVCLGAAILPLLKLLRLEPALVFRG